MDQRDLYLTVLYLEKQQRIQKLDNGVKRHGNYTTSFGKSFDFSKSKEHGFFESLHRTHFHHPECLNLQTILRAVNQLDLGD